MEDLKLLTSKEYEPLDYDFTDDDAYLLKHPEENPKESAKSLELFRKITGSTLYAHTADVVLDKMVEEGTFEKFTVHIGYKTEIVWRPCNLIEPEPVVIEDPKEIESKYIKVKTFTDYLLESAPEINYSKSEDDFLGRFTWIAGHSEGMDFKKASRKVNCEILTDSLEDLLIAVIKSTKKLNKTEWLAKVDSILEGFNGK